MGLLYTAHLVGSCFQGLKYRIPCWRQRAQYLCLCRWVCGFLRQLSISCLCFVSMTPRLWCAVERLTSSFPKPLCLKVYFFIYIWGIQGDRFLWLSVFWGFISAPAILRILGRGLLILDIIIMLGVLFSFHCQAEKKNLESPGKSRSKVCLRYVRLTL